MVRGIYFYNDKKLHYDASTYQRIHVFSEWMLKRAASAIRIQKAWKGYLFRKNNN